MNVDRGGFGLIRLGLLVFAAAFLITSAPSLAADPGISDTEITLGMWTPLTGSTSLLGTSERDAIEIGIDEVNARGGIYGRKIRLIAYDDAGSPQEAQAAVRRLISQDKVFALIAGSISGSTLPVLPLINREKIPFVSSISSNRHLLDKSSTTVFRVFSNETAHATRLLDFTFDRFAVKRPALIYTSNDYGIGGEEAVSDWLRHRGVELVAKERFNQGDQDFSSQLLRISQSGADALYIWAFAAEAGIITRQARELGLKLRLFGGASTSTPLFPKAAGKASEGFVSVTFSPHLPESSKDSHVVSYVNSLKQRYPNGLPPGRPSEYDLAGYAALKIVVEGLNRAGRDLSRERFVAALETLKNFDTGVLFPVSYSKELHEGTSEAAMITINPSLEWEPLR